MSGERVEEAARAEDKITLAELATLFGAYMPVEGWHILDDASLTIAEARAKLAALASSVGSGERVDTIGQNDQTGASASPTACSPDGQAPAGLAGLTAASPASRGPLEIVRHIKRGTEYEVLGEAEMQVAVGDYRVWQRGADPFDEGAGLPARTAHDGRSVIVYRSLGDGRLWCRFADEFRDGRFETVRAALVAGAQGAKTPEAAEGEARQNGRTEGAATPATSSERSCVPPVSEEVAELRALSEKLPQIAWCVFDRSGVLEIQNEDGDTIVHWSGFDQLTGPNERKKKVIARFIVALVNAWRSGRLIPAPAQTPVREEGAGDTVVVPREPTPEMIHVMRYGARDAKLIAIDQRPKEGETPWPRFGEALAREVYKAALAAAPPASGARSEEPSAVERAYGLLWAQPGVIDHNAKRARALLLAEIGPEGQRRAIAWAQSLQGPDAPGAGEKRP